MRKILILFLCFAMLLTMSACNSNKEDGSALFQQPDFSTPLSAEGDTVITSIDEMIEAVKTTQPFVFTFSKNLDNATQTLYTNQELTQIEKMEDTVSPLGLLNEMQDAFALKDFATLDAAHFTLKEDGKMAVCNEENQPKTFMGCVTYDISFDLTTKTFIFRGVHIIEESNVGANYYVVAKLTFVDENTYKLQLRCEEYGDNNGTEYVFITTESMEFDVENGETTNVQYFCQQDTSVYAEVLTTENDTMIRVDEHKAAERVTINVKVVYTNGEYAVNRAMSMAQTKTSYDPETAQLVYTVKQTIERRDDGSYLMSEIATADTETKSQYVTFVEKKS